MAHKYFNRKPDDWNITDFLNECEAELFRDKVGCYLTSLETIINTEKDERCERAKLLLQSRATKLVLGRRQPPSLSDVKPLSRPNTGPTGTQTTSKLGAQPDYHLSRKWKNKREQASDTGVPSVHFNNPIFTGNPLVGNSGNINGGTFVNESKREHGKVKTSRKTTLLERSIGDELSISAEDNRKRPSDEDVEQEEYDVKPTKRKPARKRRSISYTVSSEEEDRLSDLDYVEKPKRSIKNKKPRSNRSCGKAKRDAMDNGDISEDTTLVEISPSTLQAQPTITSLNNSEDNTIAQKDFSTSRESTPCPVVQPAQQVLINTPNKPIVTKVMCDKYSPYLVCVFSATINHVKETIDEGTYREIEKLFLMKNRLGITSQRWQDRDMSERTFIVECLSPIFRAFRNAFPDIKYDWIEKNVTSIREANNMFVDDISPRKTDLLVVRLSDGMEILNTEVSGPPFKATISHTVGDVKKLLMMSICSLCRIFGNNLDCSAKDAKGIKTYSIQVVGDRLTLFSVSITDQKKYLAVELASCMIPFSFDSISYYMKIFNFFAIIQAEFKEQEKLRKKIYSSIPIENTERIRDWLYLPEDSFLYDLKPIPEDIDEILMI
ncbi:hypothetical protein RhiirA4_548898 [Rhizophagus irregularis]|uniref:Uncharacterized protein n=1 Tax=Rhizophagus irregularis TaxID=588596 RepID=A0A2I1HA70_9GLOM|nr:hypothetical protein RhiirA4_548898 [Rhizophagus irregularis]